LLFDKIPVVLGIVFKTLSFEKVFENSSQVPDEISKEEKRGKDKVVRVWGVGQGP
jgi:hypothetical protein